MKMTSAHKALPSTLSCSCLELPGFVLTSESLNRPYPLPGMPPPLPAPLAPSIEIQSCSRPKGRVGRQNSRNSMHSREYDARHVGASRRRDGWTNQGLASRIPEFKASPRNQETICPCI